MEWKAKMMMKKKVEGMMNSHGWIVWLMIIQDVKKLGTLVCKGSRSWKERVSVMLVTILI